MNPLRTPGPIVPSCTTARGRPDTLMRGRDGGTRYAPPRTTAKATMADAARAAALKG
jgi:hypothetical protein